MKKERLTILACAEDDRDTIEYLQCKGVSSEGREMLRVAMLLKRADLLEPMKYVLSNGVESHQGAIGAVNVALNMAAMVRGSVAPPTPEQEGQAGQQLSTDQVSSDPEKKSKPELPDPFIAGARN